MTAVYQSIAQFFARLLLLAAIAALSLLSGAARGSTLHCGDTLGAGSWLLEQDLTCPSNSGFGVALYPTSGAQLDLGGHTVRMTIGGSGTGLDVSGTGASVVNGSITQTDTAISVKGGGHRFSGLHVNGNSVGLWFHASSDNRVVDCEVNGNAIDGIFLDASHRNLFRHVTVDDTSGIGPAAGIGLRGSNENVIVGSEISRSLCTGISMNDSSRNAVCFNKVEDTNSFFPNGPSIDLLIYGASSENLICGNQVSATKPGTGDGINVGCKGNCDCGYQTPTTGATNNLVLGNTANDEDRYGIAQSTGNPGNAYLLNHASGNGVANFAIDP